MTTLDYKPLPMHKWNMYRIAQKVTGSKNVSAMWKPCNDVLKVPRLFPPTSKPQTE